MICIGHRGASGHEPENTLRSIRRALDLGAQGVEIDVRMGGGEVMVMHDAKLQRTTNGRGLVSRKSFAQLRALDAGLGECVPTLREVCELVNRRALLNIELKGRRTAAPVVAFIEEWVRAERGTYEDFLVSSFLRRELRQIVNRRIQIGALYTRPSLLYHVVARRLHAWSVHPAARYTTRRFVKDAHRRGYKIFVYTVNAPAEIERLRALGVDGVFSDFPERVLASGR